MCFWYAPAMHMVGQRGRLACHHCAPLRSRILVVVIVIVIVVVVVVIVIVCCAARGSIGGDSADGRSQTDGR